MCPFLGFEEIRVKVRARRKYLHTLFKINKSDPFYKGRKRALQVFFSLFIRQKTSINPIPDGVLENQDTLGGRG